jgi:NAD-specific glutamate dehydrogenase
VAAADAVSALLETLTRDYLRQGETDDIAAVVARDRPAFVELERAVGDICPPHRRRLRTHRAEALVASGVHLDLAGRLAGLVDHLSHTTIDDRWSRATWRGLLDDLVDLRRLTTRQALEDHPDEIADAVARFLDRRTDLVAQISGILRDLDPDAPASLHAVMVAYRAVRGVVG